MPATAVRPLADWIPASALLDGRALDRLLDAPVRWWSARPHAAAALAWKQYTYRLAVPVVAGLDAGALPLLPATNTLLWLHDDRPYVSIRPVVRTTVAGERADLLALARRTLLEEHLLPLAAMTRGRVRINTRTLLGQFAANLARLSAAPDLLAGLGLAHLAGHDAAGMACRRTCCLALAVPGLARCADCPAVRHDSCTYT